MCSCRYSRDISATYQQVLGRSAASNVEFQQIESRFDNVDAQLKQQLSETEASTNQVTHIHEFYVSSAQTIQIELEEIKTQLQAWRDSHLTQIQQLRSVWRQEIASELQSLRDSQQTIAANIKKLEEFNDLESRLLTSQINEARLLQMTEDLQTNFMSQLSQLMPRSVIAAQLIAFEDSLGHVYHFDIQYVPDFETLHEHLMHRFRRLLGYESQMIKRKQYALFDTNTGERLPLVGGQRAFFKPGQSVVMTMCAAIDNVQVYSNCPVCGETSAELSETGITW